MNIGVYNGLLPGKKLLIKPMISQLIAIQWRHNEPDDVSIHQHYDCSLNRLSRHRSKETSKLRVTGLCAGNSPRTKGQ